MTFKLHPLPGDGRFYCGPAAIAAFTGKHPKQEVRAAINRYRGRPETRGVIGMHNHEVRAVLASLGWRCTTAYKWAIPGLTLRQFVESRPTFCGIVNVTDHYVAVAHGMALDNRSRIARPVAFFPGNRARVQFIMDVWQQ